MTDNGSGPGQQQRQQRYILHADLDAFYASVEQRDNPALRGRPVVVGGLPESRGVVAAASYEARKFGARSAMPMRTALQLSPRIVRVAPRFDRYREVSGQIMAIFHDLTPLVEPLSLDEAYLDVSDALSAERREEAARALKTRVRQETGLAVTIGGGPSKTVAKIASQVAKPDGLLLVPPGGERGFLAPLDVGLLWGVGPVTLEALKKHGLSTIGALAAADEALLQTALGRRGLELKERAVGVDDNPVRTHRDVKQVSAETTMARDVGDRAELHRLLEAQVADVVQHLRASRLVCRTVKLKLRLADFTTFSRQETLDAATDDDTVILRAARVLLDREVQPGRLFRLIGAGVSNLAARGQDGPPSAAQATQLPLLPPG
jgi:DNA polymerase-4